jgi:hypothetical protein
MHLHYRHLQQRYLGYFPDVYSAARARHAAICAMPPEQRKRHLQDFIPRPDDPAGRELPPADPLYVSRTGGGGTAAGHASEHVSDLDSIDKDDESKSDWPTADSSDAEGSSDEDYTTGRPFDEGEHSFSRLLTLRSAVGGVSLSRPSSDAIKRTSTENNNTVRL